MLQYRLKYESVRTQLPFQNNNFLFNLFSLLSIFNSTFSLSLTHVLSLFLLQITLPHPQINGTAASPINGMPSFYVSVWHSHRLLATPILGLWVCVNGECGCGFVPVVGLGCGFVWFGKCGFLPISPVVFLFLFFLFFFFFFFEVVLVDVSLCWWWLLVLLR